MIFKTQHVTSFSATLCATSALMKEEGLKDKFNLLGLKSYHLQDLNIDSTDQLIEEVIQSGMLYRTAVAHLTLSNLRRFLENQNIQPEDTLVDYFPKKNRRSSWIALKENFPLKIPGLKLTRFAQALCILSVLVFIYLNYIIFTQGIEIILALKLAGLSLYPILVVFFVIIGVILTYGTKRLPAQTVNDLMEKVVSNNHTNLLANEKSSLKSLLKQNLK